MWTKYLINKLLCYFSLKISLKATDRQTAKRLCRMRAAPCVQPLPRTRAHSPRSVQASNTPWSQWFCWDSQLHINQLLVFAPSITQLILKKKNQAPGILRNIQIFTTVFSLITKSITKAYSTLCTNSAQNHGGATTWHPDTASMDLLLELPQLAPLSSCSALQRHRCLTRCHK